MTATGGKLMSEDGGCPTAAKGLDVDRMAKRLAQMWVLKVTATQSFERRFLFAHTNVSAT